MSEWQPIDTAPKDGTIVLIWLGGEWSRVEKAWWYTEWKNWQTGEIAPHTVYEDYHGIGSGIPTHWQPLPEPPNE